ncbi:hypothetical protein Anacy_5569 [Anabaena cylindrica PCC 7122]|uniref:Uncharacterized protein n=1 Tax=Anabaena cylindrica (strain ATCC 27899 / PCC 7122) TaxID=272123 RepID=K9ZNR4_ANACC|nr:hypothetical protein Anacy_5569 [Anabaena cylindrica PCC 7122]BAY02027.1 hypothetical protein NIES19_12640 [Anabaena cylindrica PCC 7122]
MTELSTDYDSPWKEIIELYSNSQAHEIHPTRVVAHPPLTKGRVGER